MSAPALARADSAASDLVAVRVEDDDVPTAQPVAVVAAGRSGLAAEVGEVWSGICAEVLVVTDRRAGPRLESAPERVVTIREVAPRSVWVGGVSDRRDGAWAALDQAPRELGAVRVTVADIARCEQDQRGTGHLGGTRRRRAADQRDQEDRDQSTRSHRARVQSPRFPC